MANTEAKRVRRQQQQKQATPERPEAAAGGGAPSAAGGAPGTPAEARTPLVRRGSSVGTPRTGGRVSGALLDRVQSIETVVGSRMEEQTSAVDWAEEARRLGASEACEGLAGACTDGGAHAATTYTLTGNGHWLKATDDGEERARKVGGPGHAEVDEECPKCSHPRASFYTMQLRSADEGATVFYECLSCGYKWRQNN